MKRTARLYLPWPVVSASLAWVAPPAEAQPEHRGKPLASVERLEEGACYIGCRR
jgi:hypothetical protein